MKKKNVLILICTVFLLIFLMAPKRVEGSEVPLIINGQQIKYYGTQTIVTIPDTYIIPDRELRAVWVTRLTGDFTFTNDASFRQNYLAVLDTMEEYNFNTIIYHVRTHHDALYQSSINKPSDYINNISQSFDMLEWAINEAHKRGIEFHAWLNPYRIKSGTSNITHQQLRNEYAAFPDNPIHDPDNVLITSSAAILNPGEPAVREFLIETVLELIENYDVDAIHFDDYFYIKDVSDSHTRSKPGYNPQGLSIDNWRREQVNIFIRDLSQAIRNFNDENNRYIQFGIAPTGIYKNGGRGFAHGGGNNYDSNGNFITNGSNTQGQEHSQSYLYADTKKWIDNEWIDYIMPQTYWGFTRTAAPYADLVEWWAKVVRYKNVNLYTGTGLYMARDGASEDSWKSNPQEITMQIRFNTKIPEVQGTSIFSYQYILSRLHPTGEGLDTLKNEMWNTKVLRPVVKSMTGNPLGSVSNFAVDRENNKNTLTWEQLNGARGYVIYRSLGEIDFEDTSQILDIIGFENIPTLSYTDSVSSNDYNYGIRALNGANELGEGTLEGSQPEDVFYTTNVSSNFGSNLIFATQENSFYGDTNYINITTNDSYRYNFLTESGKIISYDEGYYFRVTDHQDFKAYFTPYYMKSVAYINLNKDLISFQTVYDIEDAIAPPNPGDIGLYRFIGWTKTVLASGDVIYRAAYEKSNEQQFIVSIHNGLNSYQEIVSFGQVITVQSTRPYDSTYWLVDGQKFSYDKNLEIAVYSDMIIELQVGSYLDEGFIHLREQVISKDDYFIYLGKFYIPYGVQLIESGLLISTNPSANLVLSNPNIDKLRALSTSSENEFAIKKNNINVDQTIYARGYLAYLDPVEGVVIKYSPIFSHTKELILEEYTISYELNGGTLDNTSSKFTINDLPLTLPTPTKEGYIFAGWFVESDFSGNAITTITEAKDVTVYAKWKEIIVVKTYNITYHLNEGQWGFTNKEDLALAFLTDFYNYLVATGNTPTENFETFLHGDKTSGFDGKWYEYRAHIYAANEKDVDAEKAFFINQPEYNAKWIEFLEMIEDFTKIVNDKQSFWGSTYTGNTRLRQYLANIRPGGNETAEDMLMLPTITKTATTYRNDRDLVLSIPIREGYIFKGWFEKEDFSGAAVEKIVAGSEGDKVFYAKWEQEVVETTYTITYNLNGGTLADAKATFTDKELPLILQVPTRDGFKFLGWFVAEDFSGAAVTEITEAKDTILFAKWEEVLAIEYTITYELEGGILENALETFGAFDLPLTLQVPIKEGFKFIGWFLTSNFLGEAVTQITEAKNYTLYAKWEEVQAIEYTITYELDGGELEGAIITFTSDDLPLELPIPTKWGSIFKGWYPSTSIWATRIYYLTEAKDYIIYARWETTNATVLESIINDIPKHITSDYQFPTLSGLSFRYDSMHNNDEVLFDLETGQHLKLRVTQQTRTIVATYNSTEATFEIDFGVVRKDQIGSYYRGRPGGVSLDEPNNEDYIGWSGYTLTKGELVHFVYHAIELNGSGLITNQSILNPTTSFGSVGTLYINVGDQAVSFTLSSLGDRIDSQSASVLAPVIVMEADGTIRERYTNKTKRSTMIRLEPGETLWIGKYLDRSNGLLFGRDSDFDGYLHLSVNKYNWN